MSEVKLCIDCKHNFIDRREYQRYGFSIYTPLENISRCERNLVAISQDLVSGCFQTEGELLYCQDERSEISATPNRCGVEGRYWEAK